MAQALCTWAQACEGSLRRLGVERIDLLQLHWPDRYVPMFGDVRFDCSLDYDDWAPAAEQLEAVADLIREGKARVARSRVARSRMPSIPTVYTSIGTLQSL